MITRSDISCFAGQRTRCSVSDSLARRTADVPGVPRSAEAASRRRSKVVTCRIRKAKKAHLRKPGEVLEKA